MDNFNDLPLVSVIIPVFNCENWVEHSIKSVMNQSYKKIEIIIVNDGSTDNTSKVLEKFRDYKNIFIFNIKNSGPAKARNFAVNKANGSYIAFLDADDLWNQYKLEKQINYILSKSECKLLLTNVKKINHNNLEIGLQQKKLPESREEKVIHFFQGKITMNTPTILVEKKVFCEIGGFNSALIHREDHFFLMEVAEKYEIHLLNEYLVYRRVWEGSISFDFQNVKDTDKQIIDFFEKTRHPFYKLALARFPFIKPYYSEEVAAYYNMLAMRLFRLGYIHSARQQIICALKINLNFKYIFKIIFFYLPYSVSRSLVLLRDNKKLKGVFNK